jgi:hypothetical protein
MTRSELFAVLTGVPDEAEVLIMGTPIRVVLVDLDTGDIILHEKSRRFFEESGYTILFNAATKPARRHGEGSANLQSNGNHEGNEGDRPAAG